MGTLRVTAGTWLIILLASAGAYPAHEEELDCTEDALASAMYAMARKEGMQEEEEEFEDEWHPSQRGLPVDGTGVSNEGEGDDTTHLLRPSTTPHASQLHIQGTPSPSKAVPGTSSSSAHGFSSVNRPPIQGSTLHIQGTTPHLQGTTPHLQGTASQPPRTTLHLQETTLPIQGTTPHLQGTPTPIQGPASQPPRTTIQSTPLEVIQGLEALGAVEVIQPEVALGTPSAVADTVYTLAAVSVRIVVPAGAWPDSAPGLTAKVFVLPGPGRVTGIDLGPRGQALKLPILITLPCDDPQNAAPYMFNTTSGAWTRQRAADGTRRELALWASIETLGTYAAFEEEEAGVLLGSSGATQIGTAVGIAFGALTAIGIVAGGVMSARRGAPPKSEAAPTSPIGGTELCWIHETPVTAV